MPNVVRFTLATARDLNVPGAGFFNDGVLDVDANDLSLLSRTRYLVQPYGAVEVGVVDSATPPPTLPTVPGPPSPDPYPQYLVPTEVLDAGTGRLLEAKVPTRLSETELRAAFEAILPAPAGGGADDTATLQAAINAAPVGARLLAPRGAAYSITSLTVAARLTLDFTTATVTQRAATTGHMLIVTGIGAAIRGGIWDGNAANQSASNKGILISGNSVTVEGAMVQNVKNVGIAGVGSSYLRVHRCKVVNSGYIGIFVEPNGAPYTDVAVTECFVDRSMIAAGSISEGGIKIKGNSVTNILTWSRVTDCTVLMPVSPTDGTAICIETTYAPGAVVRGSQTSGGSMGVSAAACDRTVVFGNVIFNAKAYGAELAGCRNGALVGNTIDGNGLTVHGIMLSQGGGNNSDGSTIGGNTVRGCLTDDIRVQTAKRVAVNGNTLEAVAAGGYIVSMSQADGSSLSGNTIDGGGISAKGVMLDSCSDITITGGTIRNCTESGVLAYSSQNGYAITNIVAAGVVFRAVNAQFGTQVVNGAVVGAGIRCGNNPGSADYIDFNLGVGVFTGTVSPEGSVYAGSGAIYLRQNSGQPEVWIKAGAANTNTGWLQLVREGRVVTGKVLTTGGLGVGNSAVATTPGTVTRKMEVFDAAGVSIGFVPIYGAIT